MIDFDPAKSRRNADERGLPFEAVERFEWATCQLGVSLRQEITAVRFFATGWLDDDLVTVFFTLTAVGIRVVSLRRASRRERKAYGEAQNSRN
jgi:uncharacterized DUF497 family protein